MGVDSESGHTITLDPIEDGIVVEARSMGDVVSFFNEYKKVQLVSSVAGLSTAVFSASFYAPCDVDTPPMPGGLPPKGTEKGIKVTLRLETSSERIDTKIGLPTTLGFIANYCERFPVRG